MYGRYDGRKQIEQYNRRKYSKGNLEIPKDHVLTWRNNKKVSNKIHAFFANVFVYQWNFSWKSKKNRHIVHDGNTRTDKAIFIYYVRIQIDSLIQLVVNAKSTNHRLYNVIFVGGVCAWGGEKDKEEKEGGKRDALK